jgi:hypothetical protein
MEDFQQPMHDATTSDSDRPRPTSSDDDRPRPTMSSVRREEHHLTTREALQLFEAAGLPRNQRSIERYCADGKFDAFFDSDEQRYYVSRASVDRLIGQLIEIKSRHEALGPAVSDGIRPGTTSPRQARDEQTAPPPHVEATKQKDLEDKLFNLEVDKRATEKVNNILREQIKEDRAQYFQQLQEFVKELGDTKQLVGELQTQVKRLEAPKPGTSPTTGARQVTEAEVEEEIRPATSTSAPSPESPPVYRSTLADIREPDTGERVS